MKQFEIWWAELPKPCVANCHNWHPLDPGLGGADGLAVCQRRRGSHGERLADGKTVRPAIARSRYSPCDNLRTR